MNQLRNLILRLEEYPVGFGLWMAAALGIIYLRDSLECLVSVGIFPIADLFHLLHVPIFFLSLLLVVILVLHFFSREAITKVSRVSLVFFAIILLPALLDFFISQAVKREVVYQYIMEDVGENFIQFLNPFFRLSQIPFSLRIEIAGIALLSFAYVFLKRGRWIASLLAAFFVFAACVLYGSIPAILTGLISAIFRGLIFLSGFIQLNMPEKLMGVVDERVVVIAQLLFVSVLAAAWFWRYDVSKCRVLLRNFRLERVFHYIFLAAMGAVLYFYDSRPTDMFLAVKMIGMAMAVFFACQFSAVANDIFDAEGDRLSNQERPLIAGILTREEYLKAGWVYLALACCFSIWVSDHCFMVILIFIALYFLYSAPPFRLKRFYPLNPMIIGVQALLIFLLGQVSLVPAEFLVPFYPRTSWLVFTIFFLSSHVKDLKDVEADRQCAIMTLPVMLGANKARWVTACFVFLSYLLAPFLFSTLFYHAAIFWLALLFGVANFFYIIRKDSRERFVFTTYLIFGVVLLAFLLYNVFFS